MRVCHKSQDGLIVVLIADLLMNEGHQTEETGNRAKNTERNACVLMYCRPNLKRIELLYKGNTRNARRKDSLSNVGTQHPPKA